MNGMLQWTDIPSRVNSPNLPQCYWDRPWLYSDLDQDKLLTADEWIRIIFLWCFKGHIFFSESTTITSRYSPTSSFPVCDCPPIPYKWLHMHTLTSVQLCTFTFSICLLLHPLSNRQIPRISECSHVGLHSHHHWRPNPDIRHCLCIILKQICHCQWWNIKKKSAVSELTYVSYSSLHRATWNHRSGKYVWKHLCVLFWNISQDTPFPRT